MLRILVVEDNEKNAQDIKNLILSLPDMKEDCVDVAQNVISAQGQMEKEMYDLLILDIQLPKRFPDLPTKDGGVQLLRNILDDPITYKLPFHVIGITTYEADGEIDPFFEKNTWTIIRRVAGDSDWKAKIKIKLNYLFQSKRSLKAIRNYDYDIAIMCAMDSELNAVKSLPGHWECIAIPHDDSSTYFATKWQSNGITLRVVAAVCYRPGLSASAILADKIMNVFCPKYLVMTGVAAGFKNQSINLGDILVADPVWEYSSGKLKEEDGAASFSPEPHQISLDTALRNRLKEFCGDCKRLAAIKDSWQGEKPSTSLVAHIGPVASGPAVITHSGVVKSIQNQNRKCLGLEMEIYSVYLATELGQQPKPKVLAVKGVSDFADSEKNDKFQPYAAYVSARFIYDFFTGAQAH